MATHINKEINSHNDKIKNINKDSNFQLIVIIKIINFNKNKIIKNQVKQHYFKALLNKIKIIKILFNTTTNKIKNLISPFHSEIIIKIIFKIKIKTNLISQINREIIIQMLFKTQINKIKDLLSLFHSKILIKIPFKTKTNKIKD